MGSDIEYYKRDFINRGIELYDGKYIYDLVDYVSAHVKVKIICPIHGIFEQTPSNHLHNRGCRLCGIFQKHLKFKKSKEKFVKEASHNHNDFYIYDLVDYINAKTKVKIICPIHGVFEQTPDNHLSGQGCSACNGRRFIDTEIFIKDGTALYDGKYIYNLVDYINAKTKVKIICPIHGVFEQIPDNHLNGHECQECKNNKKLTNEKFIKKAKEVHNDYIYDLVEYINCHTKVKIICPIHGVFEQVPNNHLNGARCHYCSKSQVSTMSQEWLNGFNNSNIIREHILKFENRWFKVDGYDPITNTIYEFDGDLWHGNPEVYNPEDTNPINKIKFGDLYKATVDKKVFLKDAGFKIISIWEKDFKKSINKKT